MPRFRWVRVAVVCAIGLGSAVLDEPASAIGYYNLPGTFCQCFGYGNGAGHHACLALGPSTCFGFGPPNEVRLPYPPQPPCRCAPCPCGLPADDGSWLPEPSELPPAGPSLLPSPAALRPQTLR